MTRERHVVIEKGPTALYLKCAKSGRFVDDSAISIHPFLKRHLMEYEWDPRRKQSFVTHHYFRYDRKTGTLHLPVNILHHLENYMGSFGVTAQIIELKPNDSDIIDIVNLGNFEDRENQIRGIEFLSNDHPMKALELQTGCLAGDTVINFNRNKKGFTSTIKNAYHKFHNIHSSVIFGRMWYPNDTTFVRSLTGERIQLHPIDNITYSGIKPIYLVTLENGRTIKCTLCHKIMTQWGMVRAERIVGKSVMCDNLKAVSSGRGWKKIIDHYLAVSGNHPYSNKYQNQRWNCYRVLRHRAMYDAHHLNNMTINEFLSALKDPDRVKTMQFVDPKTHAIHHIDGDHDNDRPDNLECLLHEDHRKLHNSANDPHLSFNQGIPTFSKAISIEYLGDEDTYDIVCKDPHRNFVANGIVVHNSGKTYSAVRAIMNVNRRALIVVPASLVQQWYDAMFSMVDTKVGIIRGGKSIMDIIKLDYNFEYDILLASISTLQEYACGGASYELLPPFREFIRNLRVGFKIVDECHLNFYANVMIDIQSDIRYNAYLSATHMRSKSSNTIFQKVYPPAIRFDGGVDYDRYVNITEFQYNIGYIDERWIKTNRGYAQPKYEKLLMRSPQKLDDFLERILYRVVEDYYIAKKSAGQKLLVIVGCREFATIVTAWFNATYEQLRAICFLYETPEEELNDEHVDVIVSTAGSCGTGRDIKNLRSMIVFTSFSSEQLVWQSLGRLRKLPDDTPEFVNLVNTQLPAHIRHAELKRQIYNQAGKRFTIVRS